jgi:hypothetical protein
MAISEVATPSEAARKVVSVRTGSLTVSTIQFYSELGKADGRVIPMGVMAEIALPTLRGLGMVARTELEPEELSLLGYLGERLIRRPFDYLSEQFDNAWGNSGPGTALDYLASRHLYSLHFSVPAILDIPRQLLSSEAAGATLKSAVRDTLGSLLDDHMLRLIERVDRTRPQEELLLFKAAA